MADVQQNAFPRYGDDAYTSLLLRLFRDTAMDVDPGPNFLALLQGKATGLTRLEQSSFDVLEDILPDSTVGEIERWETIVGLPDPCMPTADDLESRRRNVSGKLAATGIQTKEDAAALVVVMLGLYKTELPGVSVHRPMRMGDRMGARMYGAEWLEGWTWHFISPDIFGNVPFRMGDRMGGRLWGHRSLTENVACLVRRYTPAHLDVFILYGNYELQ